MCALVKGKAAEFFQPRQLGVACCAVAEKVAHALRGCIEEHWMDEDFVVLKVDMWNVFDMVSRQAVLDEWAAIFPELLTLGVVVLWNPSSAVAPSWPDQL